MRTMKPLRRRLALTLLIGAAAFAVHQLPIYAVARLWPGRLLTLPVALNW